MAMTLTRKLNPPLFFMMIQETSTHRHLGLTFSDSCNWRAHVNDISEKAWTRLNLFRAHRSRVSETALEKMYMGFVRPLLEYSDVVWDKCSLETKSSSMQFTRIITGAAKLCSIEKLF